MPIPKPRKGEKKDEFVSRCMGDDAMVKEYKQEQRAGICYTSWESKHPKTNEDDEFSQLVANLSVELVREEDLDSRKYKVAPVIMAVEGVMNDLLYPAEELGKFVEAWNGRPVTLFHPKSDDGEFISANSPSVSERVHLGRLYNTRFEEKALKSEVWVDVEKTARVRPEVLEYLAGNKDKLEVSTGLWGDIIPVQGTFNDAPYKGIMRNIRPDHLALLPGGEGACNWTSGCGLRANEDQDLYQGGFFRNLTDRDLRGMLSKALGALDTTTKSHYLEEIELTKKEVIYEQYTRTIGTDGNSINPPERKLFRRGYTIDNGEATLADGPVEVTRVVSYKPVSNEGDKMTKKEKIEALIKDPRTRFEAGCNDFLNGLNEDQLDRLMPPDNVVIKEEKPESNLQKVVDEEFKKAITDNQEDKKGKPKPCTAAEWLAAQESMPEEVRDSILEGIALNTMQRAEMVEAITKDPRNTFTNEQLESKPTSELKALSAFITPLADEKLADQQFFGMRIGASPKANEEVKGPEPLVMKDLTEVFQANLKK